MTATRQGHRMIVSLLPRPLAEAWARLPGRQEPRARLELLVGLLEVVAQTLTAWFVPDYLRGPPTKRAELALKALDRPTLGNRFELARAAAAAATGREEPPGFCPEGAAWLGQGATVQRIERLVRLRNDRAHPTAVDFPKEAVAETVRGIESELLALLTGMRWMASYRPFVVLRGEPTRSGAFRGQIEWLVGSRTDVGHADARWAPLLVHRGVYLADPTGSHLLDVHPWLSFCTDPKTQHASAFLLTSIPGLKRPVVANPLTGARLQAQEFENNSGARPFHLWLDERSDLDLLHDNETGRRFFEAPETLQGFEPGKVLGNVYEVRERIGSGGMAEVYRVWDRDFEEEVALKVLRPEVADDQTLRLRFEQEAEAMGRVRHPGVVPCHRPGLAEGRPCLRMALAAGGSLEEEVARRRPKKSTVIAWARQALDALSAVHACGVIHRDVKPSNFLFDGDGNLLLSDFGIALTDDQRRLTAPHETLGTLRYMAPEQRGGGAIEARADLYSMALVLHELVTGQLPVEGRVGAGVAGWFGRLLGRMGAGVAAERPSAAEALAEIERHRPAPAPARPAPEAASRRGRRTKPAAAATTRSAPQERKPDATTLDRQKRSRAAFARADGIARQAQALVEAVGPLAAEASPHHERLIASIVPMVERCQQALRHADRPLGRAEDEQTVAQLEREVETLDTLLEATHAATRSFAEAVQKGLDAKLQAAGGELHRYRQLLDATRSEQPKPAAAEVMARNRLTLSVAALASALNAATSVERVAPAGDPLRVLSFLRDLRSPTDTATATATTCRGQAKALRTLIDARTPAKPKAATPPTAAAPSPKPQPPPSGARQEPAVSRQGIGAALARALRHQSPSARLLVFAPDGKQRTFPFRGDVMTIGRGSNSNVPVPGDNRVSRSHCRIVRRGDRYVVEDCDSANGILVDGRPVKSHELTGDQEIRVGATRIRFVVEPAAHTDPRPAASARPPGAARSAGEATAHHRCRLVFAGHSMPFDQRRITIGCGPKCDVRITDDQAMPPLAATITWKSGAAILNDASDFPAQRLWRWRLAETTELEDGDAFKAGGTRFVFRRG